MRSWLIAVLLVATGTCAEFRGVPSLVSFSRSANAKLLLYFNNENQLAVLAEGKLIKLELDTHLGDAKSCCAHRATPALSRDGRRLALVHLISARPGRQAVSIYDLDSLQQKDVFSAQAIWGLSWSPDGSRLAVVADEEAGAGHDLLIVEPASAAMRPLTHGSFTLEDAKYMVSDYAAPSWSPDGAHLAVELRRTGPGANNSSAGAIVRWDLESGNPFKLADGVDPSWSPDGAKIAFFDPSRSSCFALQPDGSEKKLLFTAVRGLLGAGGGAPLVFPVVWSPDGSSLVFHQWVDADLVVDIYRLDLSSPKARRLGRSELQVVNWR